MTDGQEVKEQIRKNLKVDLKAVSKANDTYRLARTVDEKALTNCVLSQYGKYRSNLARTVDVDADSVEKNRGRYGSGYHPAEIPVNIPFEQIYFDKMGKGIYGTESPDRLGTMYRCTGCGLQFNTSMKLAPLECPICHTLTPRGILNKESPSWYKS